MASYEAHRARPTGPSFLPHAFGVRRPVGTQEAVRHSSDVPTSRCAHQASPLIDFYAGEVACAFNDTTTCENEFKNVLAVAAQSTTAKQIHDILANVALREDRYAHCLREIDALLAIDPNDSDAKSTRPFIEALSHFPDQAVQLSGPNKASVQMDGGRLPLLINGKKASYFFDTGANLSILSESEAFADTWSKASATTPTRPVLVTESPITTHKVNRGLSAHSEVTAMGRSSIYCRKNQ